MDTSATADAPVLLTVEEAAERLRISRTSMYRLVSTGEVETVTVGRLRRVPAECLIEYVARLRQDCLSPSSAA
jgi:excisionase family DNA binding protein